MSEGTNDTPPDILNAVRRIGADAALRPVLHWLFGLCRINEASGSDFREGQRNVGIELHALLDEADPRLFLQLCSESAAREIERRTREAAAGPGQP